MISPGTAKTSRPSSSAKSARDERTASLARLDHNRRAAETGDDPVAGREAPRRRLDPGRVLRGDEPTLHDLARERRVRRRIVAVDPAAEDGDRNVRHAPARRGAPRRRRREPGRSRRRGPRPRAPDRACGRPACRTASTRGRRRSRRPAGPAARAAPSRAGRARAEDRGWHRGAAGSRTPTGRRSADRARAAARAPPARRTPPGSGRSEPTAARRRDARRLPPRTPPKRARSRRHSFGERYASASATCCGSTALRSRQGGRRACDPRDARSPARRQRQPLDCPGKQLVGGGGASRRGRAQPLPRGDDAFAHRVGRLRWAGGELLRSGPRHRDDQVEAVEQRARELVAEGCEALCRAGALRCRVAAPRARAEVHGRDERTRVFAIRTTRGRRRSSSATASRQRRSGRSSARRTGRGNSRSCWWSMRMGQTVTWSCEVVRPWTVRSGLRMDAVWRSCSKAGCGS